jgi:hypothetical protein
MDVAATRLYAVDCHVHPVWRVRIQVPVVGGAVVVSVVVGVGEGDGDGEVTGWVGFTMWTVGVGDGVGEGEGDGDADLEGDADGEADFDGFADGGGAEATSEDDGCELAAALDGVPVGIGTSGVGVPAPLVATAAAAEPVVDAAPSGRSVAGEPRSAISAMTTIPAAANEATVIRAGPGSKRRLLRGGRGKPSASNVPASRSTCRLNSLASGAGSAHSCSVWCRSHGGTAGSGAKP